MKIYLIKRQKFLIQNTSNYILLSQKIGLIFNNKVLQKLKLSKNVINEKCASKIILFNEIS